MAFKFVPYAPGGAGKDPVLTELTVTENGVYDNPVIEGERSITWDGVAGDRVTVKSGEEMMYTKLSDKILSVEDLLGGTIVTNQEREYILDSTTAFELGDVILGTELVVVAPKANATLPLGSETITFPEAGIYFFGVAPAFYVTSFTLASAPSTPADGWNKVTVNVAGDIIDVSELPTEGIEEGKIYRVTTVSEGSVTYYVYDGTSVRTLEEWADANSGEGGYIKGVYTIVDELPENPESMDASTKTVPVYVLKETGEGFFWTAGGTWMSVTDIFNMVYGGTYSHMGAVDTVDSMTQIGLYTIMTPGDSSVTYGIPDEANNKTVYEHTSAGGWAAVNNDIVDVIELPTENVDPDKIYRVTERSPEYIEVYIASGGQSYTLAGLYQFFNDYVGDGQMNGNGILPTVLYEAVDTVPAIEDIPAEYLFPKVANYTETWTGKCFILKSTGEPYIGVQGEGVLSVPSMISDSFRLPATFTGFIDSLETIPSGDVVATVYVPGGVTIAYGIPNAHPVKRLVDGVWTDLS